MNTKYKKGQRLILSLNNTQEIFEGEYESGSSNRIDLCNVVEHYTGLIIGDLLSFYESEIQSIQLFDNEPNPTVEPDTNQPSPSKDIIALPRAEYERLKELSKNCIYMATVDKRYLDATTYLSGCEHVGVAAIGSENGRRNPINVLVMCAWDQAYVFDLKSFRKSKFLPELKYVLESRDVKKVVHDSRTLVDCLYHFHGVSLTNVFDTQVADVILSKRNGKALEKTRTISECLHEYLNFPLSLLDKVLSISAEKWNERPLKESRKVSASLLGSYLITLKTHMDNLLLKDFYAAVDVYANHMKKMNPYEVSQCNTNAVPKEINDMIC